MKADYKLGICFDNNDPLNLSRIRVIPINILGDSISMSDILTYIKREDNNALSTLLYKPWELGVNGFRERDRFLCEPFLPKNISVTPNAGQLVKIIEYDDLGFRKEFVGPYTIDQISLNEQYRNVLSNLQKNIDLSEVVPQKNKISLSGYNSEQIIIGGDEYVVRLSHIEKNKKRKSTYPFTQLVQLNNSYDVVERDTIITENPDISIDYILEIVINYIPKTTLLDKNINIEVFLYKTSSKLNTQGKIGLTRDTYNPNLNYLNNDYSVKHIISSNNFKEVNKHLNDVINGYKSGNIKYYNPSNLNTTQLIKNDLTDITVINNQSITPNEGGGSNSIDMIDGLRNWLVRLKPNTKLTNYNGSLSEPRVRNELNNINLEEYITLSTFINSYNKEIRYGALAINNTRTSLVRQKLNVSKNKPLSVNVIHSDKQLFLSSLNTVNIIDNKKIDGLSGENITNLLNSSTTNTQTYGLVRGERLMEFLLELLEMLEQHGHEIGKDPRSSIVQSTQQSIENLKKKIKDELKQTVSNTIINHNLRTN